MGTKIKESKERKKVISCGTLVYRNFGKEWNDTEILLIKQFAHKNNWGIPKGHINKNETIEQCAIRETREEAGIDVTLEQRLPNVISTYKKEDKTVVSFLAQQICARIPDASDPDSEVADVRWFKINELPQIVAYQQTIITIGLAIIYSVFKSKNMFDII